MADTKLPALTALTAPALADLLYSVDVSDTTDDASGSSRYMSLQTLLQHLPHGLDEISITTTATATIGRIHVCSGTTSDYTVTLPAVSGNTGKILTIRISNSCTKLITIDGNGSETIDGATTRIMWAGESATLLCDGTQWVKIAGRSLPMACQLEATVNQNNITIDSYVVVLLDTQSFNAGMSPNLASDRIVVTRPGRYICTGNMYITGTSSTGLHGYLRKNGTVAAYAGIATSFYGLGINVQLTTDLVATDYLELIAYASGGSANINNTADATATRARLTLVEVPTW